MGLQESRLGAENADEMLAVPGVDGCMIGEFKGTHSFRCTSGSSPMACKQGLWTSVWTSVFRALLATSPSTRKRSTRSSLPPGNTTSLSLVLACAFPEAFLDLTCFAHLRTLAAGVPCWSSVWQRALEASLCLLTRSLWSPARLLQLALLTTPSRSSSKATLSTEPPVALRLAELYLCALKVQRTAGMDLESHSIVSSPLHFDAYSSHDTHRAFVFSTSM